jgi:hypothetical protein
MSDTTKKEQILKIFEKIKKNYNINNQYLYHKGKPILNEKNFKLLKKSANENIKNPTKDIKVIIISIHILEKNIGTIKSILTVNCSQFTLNTDSKIQSNSDDFGQTFTFTSNELIKHGFKKTYLSKMANSIIKDIVDYSNDSTSITDLLKLYKK